MYESNKKLTVEELKDLYPGIALLEGYDPSFVGVVTAPNDTFLPVYDTFKLIDIISDMKFETKEQINKYFDRIVNEAKGDNGLGPLFMQSALIVSKEDVEEAIRKKLDGVDDDEDGVLYDRDENDSGEVYIEFESDDSNIEFYLDDEDEEDDDDSDMSGMQIYDEDEYEESDDEYEEHKDDAFLQVTVHIGTNNPKDCKITSDVDAIKEAIKLLFPKLPRLDMVKGMKFYFANIEDLDELDEDDMD